MVICKFFLQGNCRFGSSCRFEHSYSSKYSYHAPQSNVPPAVQAAPTVTDEQLVNQVRADVVAALKGGQWLLSSYAPFKEKPVIPGISDLSPEEARLFIYEAKAKNNVDDAVVFLNNLTKETRQKYEQLLQPNPTIINTLRKIYSGENVTSPFSAPNTFGQSNNAASSMFRNAVQNTGSVFGQSNTPASAFGQTNTAASVFGQANSNVLAASLDKAQSIFAQATQNVFASSQQQNQSPFGAQSPDAAKSIFAQAAQNVAQPSQNIFQTQQQANPTNIFASASQQFFGKPAETSPFGQSGSPFGQTGSPFTQQPTHVFQKPEQPSKVFGNQNVGTTQNDVVTGIYSEANDLTVNDLTAFTSPEFKLGFIPELPPPQRLCT